MTDFFQLVRPFFWNLYSKKLLNSIESPKFAGILAEGDLEDKNARLVTGSDGAIEDGNKVCLYWLVDKDNGTILDVRFQAYGQSALIGAADAASFLLIGKNYDQARRITADLLDKEQRDKENEPAFPKDAYPHLDLVLGAIEKASALCTDLPLPDIYVAPPLPRDMGEVVEGGFPGWLDLPLKKKLAVIEDVLDREIRPYIALDAGGVEILDLRNDKELLITYQGSCTSCYSSIGTTLSFIQHMLRAKVHPEITVIPDTQF